MNSKPLHIRCGDDILPVLKERLPGEALRWADPLSEGPPRRIAAGETNESVARDFENRVQFLVTNYGRGSEQTREYLRSQDETLAKLALDEAGRPAADIVLWFEHDLFDHVILLYLLQWLEEHGFAGTDRVRLIQIDRHASISAPQIFHGLGQLAPEDIVALYTDQGGAPLTEDHWRSARLAWNAWLDPAPDKLARIATGAQASPGFPFLAAAFARHLREFPAAMTGLNATERMILEAIQDDSVSAAGLFRYYTERDALLGLGDLMFWPRIAGLAFVKNPLLQCEADGRVLTQSDDFFDICRSGEMERLRALNVSITDFGQSVLTGQADHISENGIDCWRGGVHLKTPDSVWRWDSDAETIRRG